MEKYIILYIIIKYKFSGIQVRFSAKVDSAALPRTRALFSWKRQYTKDTSCESFRHNSRK